MLDKALAKIFGTRNEREVKKMRPLAAEITALEPQMQALTDAELSQKTVEFRERMAQGATLDDLIDHTVCRVLELFDIHVPGPRWEGLDDPGVQPQGVGAA